jgi:hypothetical protein
LMWHIVFAPIFASFWKNAQRLAICRPFDETQVARNWTSDLYHRCKTASVVTVEIGDDGATIKVACCCDVKSVRIKLEYSAINVVNGR